MDDEKKKGRGFETWVKTDSMADVAEGYSMSGFQWTESEGEVNKPLDLK